jgi:hypothetical protein
MARNALWINGRDVGRDFGFVPERFSTLGASFNTALGSTALLGRAGVLRTLGTVTPQAGTFVADGAFLGTSAAALKTNISGFFRWVRAGELCEIRTALDPDRVFYGVLQSSSFTIGSPQALSRSTEKGTLTFQLFSPLRYDRTFRMYAGITSQRVMPLLGNFPSAPELLLWHPSGVTNASVSLYRANGSLIKTVVFTLTMANDDHIRVLCDDMQIFTSLNGVVTEDATIAPYGDPFFILDPADGDPVNDLFPYFIGNNCHVQANVRRLWTTE